MKVVINTCFGGFSISRKAAEHMAAAGSKRAQKELSKSKPDRFSGYGYVNGMDGGYDRIDPLLVGAVEALGSSASGSCSQLSVVEIPDGTDYTIEEYDGAEHIAEVHRTWS